MDKTQFAWQPTPDTIRRARLSGFLAAHKLASYTALYERSINDTAWFTEAVLEFLDVRFDVPYRQILDLSRGREWPQWCVGGALNITKTCLDKHLTTPLADAPALIWEGEEGPTRVLTYTELARETGRCAAGLRALGLQPGDAVGLHLPMIPETVVALLALARIGAIAVPLFSGFGPKAIADRLNDVAAKALITCDGFPRRGKTVNALSVAVEAAAASPSVRRLIVVPRVAETIAGGHMTWPDLVATGHDTSAAPTQAEDPLIIIYSSGTTGRPKGIAHTHCGFPVKSAQDMAFGTDVGPGTRICWVTDIGWMMGPWLIYGALMLGGTLVLYDGAPDFPAPDRLWEFCARHAIEVLGVSPSLIRALSTQGDELPQRHDLSRLRILAATGEPWNPAPWWWLFERVGRGKLPIINYSGGTEISGGILMGSPLLPIKPCSFPAPCPGIAADVLDESGGSVRGAVGELVIKQPWIGQARGFWHAPERYLETYWSRFPGVWVHGDWAQVDADGHWYILGRSDDTLKIAGKRVGPAEVESILVSAPEVVEAAVIGVPDDAKGTRMIAFCVLQVSVSEDLAVRLRGLVAAELGKPLAPSQVHFVTALPKTRNGKVMRRVIRAACLGEDLGDISALENPATLAALRNF